MAEKRLVKVAVTQKLVAAMDTYVESSDSYSSRQEFISDAIANHLADMEVIESGRGVSSATAGTEPSQSPAIGTSADRLQTVEAGTPAKEPGLPDEDLRPVTALDSTEAQNLSRVTFPEGGILQPLGMMQKRSEPTWGLHNRDYPTLWAASRLAAELDAHETVSYFSWLSDTTALAWNMAYSLADSTIDLSGFPMNRAKAEKSEARFVRFFVGEEPGVGPLFDMGIASVDEYGEVGLSSAGAQLVERLDGWIPTVDEAPIGNAAADFLDHLALRAPADFDLLHEIVRAIDGGVSEREALVAALGSEREWSKQTAATNVAGYIGRARQWGLVERKQENRHYVLVNDALELLDELADDREEDWRW